MASTTVAVDVQEYRREGYLVVRPGLTPTQVDELRGEAQKLIELCQRERDRHTARIEWEADYAAAGATVASAGVIRKIEPVSDISPLFSHVAFDEAIVQSVTAILECDVELFEDKLNLKLPGGSGFPWHQDWNCCWRAHTDQLVTCFVYLDDADESNGCLRVVPRSHSGKPIYPFRQGSGFEVDTAAFDEDRSIAVPLDAGEIIVFDPYLLHMSGPNRSAVPRRSIIYTYNPAPLGRINEGRFPTDFAGAPTVRL